MKYLLVAAALTGLAFNAIVNSAWPWLAAIIGIALALYLGRSAKLTTRVQLIMVGALGGGLGAEIVRTAFLAGRSAASSGGMYRQVLIVSLGSAVIVLAAMIAQFIVEKLVKRMRG